MKILSLKLFAAFIIPLFLSNFALADGQRADDTSILDIDASGEVDAMTDGLLMMRSMFGFTDDVLSTELLQRTVLNVIRNKYKSIYPELEALQSLN